MSGAQQRIVEARQTPVGGGLTALEAAVMDAASRYAAANRESAKRFVSADAVMPGGNTRSVLYFAPFPLCMVRGEGCVLWDADGHRYIDLLAEFPAGIFGH